MGYAWTGDGALADPVRHSKTFSAESGSAAGTPAPSPAGGPAMADIAELARAARLRRCAVTLEALWVRMLNLRTWFLLAAPTDAEREALAPRVIERDGRRSVLLFSDELGAVQYHVRHGSQAVDAASTSAEQSGPAERVPRQCGTGLELELPVLGPILERLITEGVYSAIFDIDEEAFEVPLSSLAPLCPRRGPADLSKLLEATVMHGLGGRVDFRSLFEQAAAGGPPRERAIDSVLALDDWWFICNPREPDAIFVRRREGRSVLMIFTDQRRALVATRQMGVTDPEGMILLLQLPVVEAVEWLPAFASEGVIDVAFDGIQGFLGGGLGGGLAGGLRTSIEELRGCWAMRAETA